MAGSNEKQLRVVYLASPYRHETEYGVHLNIQRAERLALEIWRLGAVCICPVKNTAYFGGAMPDEAWLRGDLELVRRSDALLASPEWQSSKGATREVEFAQGRGIPVFYSVQEVADWLEGTV